MPRSLRGWPGFIGHRPAVAPASALTFQVVTASKPALQRALAERNLDLVIEWIDHTKVDENLVEERLFDDAYVVATGTDNPWTRRRRVDLAGLVHEPWTFPSQESAATIFAANAFRASGLKPPRATVLALSLNLRNRLLASGRFLTMLSDATPNLHGKNPSLKALPINLPTTRRTSHLEEPHAQSARSAVY